MWVITIVKKLRIDEAKSSNIMLKGLIQKALGDFDDEDYKDE